MPKYDLAYKSIPELTADASAPASGDFLVRYDASATSPKKVGATDLEAMLGITASLAEVNLNDGQTATAAEVNNAADVSARVVEVTATAGGTIAVGVQSIELNHASVIAAATIADAANHPGLFIVKDTSATGTAAHTLTLTAGTFNGTNNVATLNARDEALVVYFDSTGRGTVILNLGSVALS